MLSERSIAVVLSVSSFCAETTQRRFLASCASDEEAEEAEEAECVLSVSFSLSVSDSDDGRLSDLRDFLLRFECFDLSSSEDETRLLSSLSVELPDNGDSGDCGDA